MGQLRFRRETTCAFCGDPPDSKEHAWPHWLLTHLSSETGRLQGVVEGDEARIDVTQKAIKIPCVCESCNTSWMKALEDAARPLLMPLFDGEIRRLTVPQQALIAEWAVKTAMVFEYVTHRRSLFYSKLDRRTMRRHDVMPSYSAVWLGHYAPLASGDVRIATFGSDGGGVDTSGPDIAAYTNSMLFGQLLIQVVTVRPNEGEQRRAVIHPNREWPWHLSTLRIWPARDAVEWPPQQAFSLETFEKFTRRWDNPSHHDGGWDSANIITIPAS